MSIGLSELIVIAVAVCVLLLLVVGVSGLVVWFVSRKQRHDEPGSGGSSLD